MINSSAAGTASIIDFRVRIPFGLCPELQHSTEHLSQYNAVLDIKDKMASAQTVEDVLSAMDSNNIAHAVMHAEHEVGDIADSLNHTLYTIINQHPDRFSGVGTISLDGFTIKKALRQIDDCIEKGFIGLSLQPAFFGWSIDDKRLYPIYAKALENNLLLALHTGINYTTHCPMSGENPMLLDGIACDFPGLTLVASHAGWPWVNELVAVARKHPNVFIDFGGLSPKYIGADGGGWGVMHRFMNSLLTDQILFSSDWPTMSHERIIQEWKDLDLKPRVLEKLFSANSALLIKQHAN